MKYTLNYPKNWSSQTRPPQVTVITFYFIYKTSGIKDVLSYCKGMLYIIPFWILYVVSIIWLMPKIGFWGALFIGIGVYIAGAMGLNMFLKPF